MNDFERSYYRFFRKGVSLPAENPVLMNTVMLKKAFLDSNQPELSVDEKDIIARKFAATILSRALTSRASSLSIEPQQDISLVNLTLDGSEYTLFRFSISNHKAMVDAMMKLAKIDPSRHEGFDRFSRCKIKYRGHPYILAYSFCQTPTGEKVVVHIIDPRLNELPIEQLGLQNRSLDRLKQAMEETGIILVTGPSGSGKSTTLQVLARYATTLGKRVFTIEDIVGLKIEGARQFQVKPQGPAKATMLQAIQAKNADIVIIDEIDEETLPAALAAVESGSLLLLAMTAPGTSEAVSKLLCTGVSRSRIASTLKLALTRKVIRKLCPACKTTASIHPATMSQWQIPEHLEFQTATGCDACNHKGYQGNLSLMEQLVISQPLAELIKEGASGPEVFEAARLEGMLTLFEQGFNKVIDGTTSLEELLAAIPYSEPFPVKARMRMGRVMPLQKASESREPVATRLFEKRRGSSGVPSEEKLSPPAKDEISITFSDANTLPEQKAGIINEAQATGTTAQGAANENRANILLVDDSPVTLEFTRHILELSGHFNVDTTDAARKALEMLQEKQYHLVITDQEMPEQTGQEFINSIRQHPSLNSVGIILLTGNLNEISALDSGADGYIAKPTDPELLVARAKSIADIYRRLSGSAPAKPAATISTRTATSISGTPGKVEFTAKDMAKISGLELDIPLSTTPAPTAPVVTAEDEDTSGFDDIFK
jgi:type II secretory ATPase GspE/PulE/Tfp pilus assembly ATPase PilB-like protein/DNA-binding response OmpR family regulator